MVCALSNSRLEHDFQGARGRRRWQCTEKLFRDQSDNQAHAFHLGTTTKCPPRGLPAAQSARIHAQRLKLSNWVLSNRTILTLSCRHPNAHARSGADAFLRLSQSRANTGRSPSNKSERFEAVSASSCSLSAWDRRHRGQHMTMDYTGPECETSHTIGASIRLRI